MGVAYEIKTFEVDKDTESRIQIDNRYYIDMDEGRILFEDDIEDVIRELRIGNEWVNGCTDEEVLAEYSIISSDEFDDYCYGIISVEFFHTSHGDVICNVLYAM